MGGVCFSDHHDDYVDKMRRLRDECVRLRLHGLAVFSGLSMSECLHGYDGIGPDWDQRMLFDIVDHINHIFESAGLIQDLQYRYCKDRTMMSFDKVNVKFYDNCVIIAKDRYGWYDPRRYLAMHDARKLYQASVMHGLRSWEENTRRFHS